MNVIKISFLWTAGYDTLVNSVFFNLLKIISKKEIIFTKPNNADILVLGPYNLESLSNRYKNILARRFKSKKIEDFLDNFQKKIFFRENKPITIFYSHENTRYNSIKSDFSITCDFNFDNDHHLRFPIWKENIDWSHEGIRRSNNTFMINRFGSFYNIDDLLKPLGPSFLDKKNFCIFTSHMNEPRKTIYEVFSKHFQVDGYGPYFNKKIKNHNESNFKKLEILNKYAFNLCPHNAIYPGNYEEKIPEAFLGGCLPISWADQNISHDFNIKAFINLNDYYKDNFQEIISLLKEKSFLKKFIDQPLLLTRPNLDNEIKFVKKVINSL